MRTGLTARVTLVGMFAAMCSTPLFAAPPQLSPLLGTWEADLSKSSFKGRAPYRTGKMTFTAVDGQSVHVVCDVVTASGIPFHFEYEGPEDGSVVRVVGTPYYNGASMSWEDERTLKRTERRAGEITGTTTILPWPRRQLALDQSGTTSTVTVMPCWVPLVKMTPSIGGTSP